jgi:hypothetical protein
MLGTSIMESGLPARAGTLISLSLLEPRQFGYVVAHLKLKLDPMLGHRSNGRTLSSAGWKPLTRKQRRDTMRTRRVPHKVSSWRTL